uniref:Uncharacterized protein n=1 Tax=Panagrolaimus sp. PS1159 TaxID=55785 RepID=A0AC35GXA3_9BILA
MPQHNQQSLAASSQHASPTVASHPQQLPPPGQYHQAEVTPSAQPMLQYTPPTTTVSQHVQVQNKHYYTVSQAPTPPSSSRQPQLSRMLSKRSIHRTSQQQQQEQQHFQYPLNHYASTHSISTSSSTGSTFVQPSAQMPQPLQQQQQLLQQWQNQQNAIQYPEQIPGPMIPQQPQQPYCYPSNNANYHSQPAMPLSLAQPQQQQLYLQQQQPPTSTEAYYPQGSQTLNQHSQYSTIQNYETPATFTSPHLSPIIDSDTSGYQTLSPDPFFNFTNDSFQ